MPRQAVHGHRATGGWPCCDYWGSSPSLPHPPTGNALFPCCRFSEMASFFHSSTTTFILLLPHMPCFTTLPKGWLTPGAHPGFHTTPRLCMATVLWLAGPAMHSRDLSPFSLLPLLRASRPLPFQCPSFLVLPSTQDSSNPLHISSFLASTQKPILYRAKQCNDII